MKPIIFWFIMLSNAFSLLNIKVYRHRLPTRTCSILYSSAQNSLKSINAVINGDATLLKTYSSLMKNGLLADALITDPPYCEFIIHSCIHTFIHSLQRKCMAVRNVLISTIICISYLSCMNTILSFRHHSMV
jgi:hypothetical protein